MIYYYLKYNKPSNSFHSVLKVAKIKRTPVKIDGERCIS